MHLKDEKMSMSKDAPPSPLIGARLILVETMTLLMICTYVTRNVGEYLKN